MKRIKLTAIRKVQYDDLMEMMIHEGKRVQTIRKDANKNEFRALCELSGKLCVIESKGVSSFGDFSQALLDEGVAEAIYLDMGPGWNYSWYRDDSGVPHEITTIESFIQLIG